MWVRLDDGFYDHQKARAAGKDGRELFIAGLCRVAETLSDGFIPDYDLPLLAAKAEVRPKPTATTLVKVGLWEKVEGGWLVHDYHDFNPTAEAEREKRRKRAEAGRKGGLRSRPPGRAGKPPAEANASANASPNAEAEVEAEDKQIGTPSPSSLLVKFSLQSSSTVRGPDDDEDARLLAETARLAGTRRHQRRRTERPDLPMPFPASHLDKCIAQCAADQRLVGLVRQHPDWTAETLVDDYERHPAAPALALVPQVPITDPDCPDCEGHGVLWVDDRTTRECPCKLRGAS